MKKLILIILCVITLHVRAQQKSDVVDFNKHKIVMQFTDSDSLSQASVTGQVKNIRAAWPNADIEVVCHGPGLDLLIATKSKASKAVAEWSAQGVIFGACNNTMRRQKINKEQLLPSAQVVPSAMIELTLKQEAGWAYVKGGH
ncbi:MAG: DsrE family protein [Bacteroidia bacterium]|nr:DsrE family protein [Bacteroidia bacterium]